MQRAFMVALIESRAEIVPVEIGEDVFDHKWVPVWPLGRDLVSQYLLEHQADQAGSIMAIRPRCDNPSGPPDRVDDHGAQLSESPAPRAPFVY